MVVKAHSSRSPSKQGVWCLGTAGQAEGAAGKGPSDPEGTPRAGSLQRGVPWAMHEVMVRAQKQLERTLRIQEAHRKVETQLLERGRALRILEAHHGPDHYEVVRTQF
jgi:hypothetical protein